MFQAQWTLSEYGNLLSDNLPGDNRPKWYSQVILDSGALYQLSLDNQK